MESSSQPLVNTSEHVNGVEEQDPMEDINRQLEDIISTYGSASSLIEDQISVLENEEKKLEEEAAAEDKVASAEDGEEATVEKLFKSLGKDACLLLQSLNKLSSPEEKVETVLKKYAELLQEQRKDRTQLTLLQHKQGLLFKQREQLQVQHSHTILARSKLESLCRELQRRHKTLREDMLQKCREEETKRMEITTHFQSALVDIQAQIEHQSSRNTSLCKENSELADKLKAIIEQYEQREESLEKLFKQKDLQQELVDARLVEAELRLKEVQEKHTREKEYLLKEAIEKTKTCFTMKEQELQMKKQLVLYSEKFDEFQATLGKSNEVYLTFKQEMDKMNKKMKKLEVESNTWKIRFENCNKTLTDMIEERSEKGKELELFTLKIAKLETLCRALQEERKVLYSKIKEIRLQRLAASAPGKGPLIEEAPEIPEIPEFTLPAEPESACNPALTPEMEKLWKEQERLQKFAASLMASTTDDMEDSENEEQPNPAPMAPLPSRPPMGKIESILEEPSCLEEGTQQIVTEKICEPLSTVCEPVKTETVKTEVKQEHIKQESCEETSKADSPEEEPTKERIEPVKKDTPEHKSFLPKPAQQNEAKVLKTETAQLESQSTEEPNTVQGPKVKTAGEALHSAEPTTEEFIKEDISPSKPITEELIREDISPAEHTTEELIREDISPATEPTTEVKSTDSGQGTSLAPGEKFMKTEASTSEPTELEPAGPTGPEQELPKPQPSSSQETKPKTSKPQPKKNKKTGSAKIKSAAKSAKKS